MGRTITEIITSGGGSYFIVKWDDDDVYARQRLETARDKFILGVVDTIRIEPRADGSYAVSGPNEKILQLRDELLESWVNQR